jgi:hypothetical protein
MRSTFVGKPFLLGCGRPRRVLLFFKLPSGAANRFGAGLVVRGFKALSSPFCNLRAISSSRRICSSAAASFGFLFSITFLTLMISPSRRPSERIV